MVWALPQTKNKVSKGKPLLSRKFCGFYLGPLPGPTSTSRGSRSKEGFSADGPTYIQYIRKYYTLKRHQCFNSHAVLCYFEDEQSRAEKRHKKPELTCSVSNCYVFFPAFKCIAKNKKRLNITGFICCFPTW